MVENAGYSGTPLPKKLGVKAAHAVWLVDAPRGFEKTLGEMPENARIVRTASGSERFDVIVLFATTAKGLERGLEGAKKRLVENGGLWIAWPKKTSGVVTELSDGVVRARGLASGLVDNKVCAIDATWSGLRFVVRLRDRKRG